MVNNRMNIYGFAHKGLKNALSQLLLELGKADTANPTDIANIKNKTQEVITLLHLHQEAEDSCVMAPLAERAPDVAHACHAEHTKLHEMVNGIEHDVAQLGAGESPDKLESVYQSLGRFYSSYLAHMAEEEATLNEAIWKHFSDDEIMQWQGQIMEKLTFEQQILWFKYIVPALNPMERQILLGGVKANAPEPAYQQVITMLKSVLTPEELVSLVA